MHPSEYVSFDQENQLKYWQKMKVRSDFHIKLVKQKKSIVFMLQTNFLIHIASVKRLQ